MHKRDNMLKTKASFSSFSVKDLAKAKKFYSNVLGIKVKIDDMGMSLMPSNGGTIYVYPKGNRKPATFTALNLVVNDVERRSTISGARE